MEVKKSKTNLKTLLIIDFILSLTLLVMGILIQIFLGSARAHNGAVLWDFSWIIIIISLILLGILAIFTAVFLIKRKKEVLN